MILYPDLNKFGYKYGCMTIDELDDSWRTLFEAALKIQLFSRNFTQFSGPIFFV